MSIANPLQVFKGSSFLWTSTEILIWEKRNNCIYCLSAAMNHSRSGVPVLELNSLSALAVRARFHTKTTLLGLQL